MAFFDPINCFIVVFFIVKEVKSEESCSGTTSGFQVVHNLRVLSIRIEKKVNYFYEVTTSD